MSKPSKNLISVIEENLESVCRDLCDFDLFEDRVALEVLLQTSEAMLKIVEEKNAELRERKKIKSCKNLVMARRPYGKKLELIPVCMRAGADPELCAEKCDYSNAASEKSQKFRYALIGPQGIGKSLYASRLATALGVDRILDDGYDWPKEPETEFVANTLLVTNHTNLQADANTIIFRVQDKSDLLLLISDLEAVPFDPCAEDPDFFKDIKIGDVGVVKWPASKNKTQVSGYVIGVYPHSIRVRYQPTNKKAFYETTFLRRTGMAKRVAIGFESGNSSQVRFQNA